MGLFSTIKNNLEKAKVATIVQNLLELHSNNGLFDDDPAKIANYLTALVWEEIPDLFNGKFDRRPHKYATAVFAVVNGLKIYDKGTRNRKCLLQSAGQILAEVEANFLMYDFTELDIHFFQSASDTLSLEMDEFLHYSNAQKQYPEKIHIGIDKTNEVNPSDSIQTQFHKRLNNDKEKKKVAQSASIVTVTCVNENCRQKIRLTGEFRSNDKLSVVCPVCKGKFKFIVSF